MVSGLFLNGWQTPAGFLPNSDRSLFKVQLEFIQGPVGVFIFPFTSHSKYK